MLLFLLAAGLSLIFGLMDVVNLAHGGFYMLGAYLALSLVRWTGSFWIALAVVPLLTAAGGFLLEWELLRPRHRPAWTARSSSSGPSSPCTGCSSSPSGRPWASPCGSSSAGPGWEPPCGPESPTRR